MKVVGDRIWGLLRMNRKGDWRASGSGEAVFDPGSIPIEAVRVARDVARGLHTQCIAYDMLLDEHRRPLIAEISYAFGYTGGEQQAAGYWDADLVRHEQSFDFWDDIVADLLERIAARKHAQAGQNAVS
jgi:hypothetical protein